MGKAFIALIIASVACGSAWGDVIQDFEQVATGDLNLTGWTASSNNSKIVLGSTPSGSQYLQIQDTSTSSLDYATYVPTSPISATGEVAISFLLRREAGTGANANNADFVIFGKNTNTTVVQTGIKANGSFYYVTGGSTTVTIPALTATDGVWYRFDLQYQVDTATLKSTYSLIITDTGTGQGLGSYPGLSGRTLTDISFANIAGVQFKTTTSGSGLVDVDDIAISAVPEPASLAVVGAGILLAARRRQNRR